MGCKPILCFFPGFIGLLQLVNKVVASETMKRRLQMFSMRWGSGIREFSFFKLIDFQIIPLDNNFLILLVRITLHIFLICTRYGLVLWCC